MTAPSPVVCPVCGKGRCYTSCVDDCLYCTNRFCPDAKPSKQAENSRYRIPNRGRDKIAGDIK